MLLNQHTMLFEPDADIDTTRVGILDPNCKVSSIVEHAFNQAAFLCEEYYLCAPELDMTTHNFVEPGKPVELVYPPNHLHHILFELFKNSMRAVVESRKKGLDLPDIEVLIVKGQHDVSKFATNTSAQEPLRVLCRIIVNFCFYFIDITENK